MSALTKTKAWFAALNDRLRGVRLYLLGFLLALPDLLDGAVALLDLVGGLDVGAVLPAAYQGYGARASLAVLALRYALPLVSAGLRRLFRARGAKSEA